MTDSPVKFFKAGDVIVSLEDQYSIRFVTDKDKNLSFHFYAPVRYIDKVYNSYEFEEGSDLNYGFWFDEMWSKGYFMPAKFRLATPVETEYFKNAGKPAVLPEDIFREDLEKLYPEKATKSEFLYRITPSGIETIK